MTILHHLAQAAAVILLVELLVFLILFLAIAGGLAFGLHWVRGKTDWAFDKANGYLPLVTKYTSLGTGLAAKPFILGGGTAARVRATFDSIRRQVRAQRAPAEDLEPAVVASRPVDPDATTVLPAASDPTTAVPAVPESGVHA